MSNFTRYFKGKDNTQYKADYYDLGRKYSIFVVKIEGIMTEQEFENFIKQNKLEAFDDTDK